MCVSLLGRVNKGHNAGDKHNISQLQLEVEITRSRLHVLVPADAPLPHVSNIVSLEIVCVTELWSPVQVLLWSSDRSARGPAPWPLHSK